MAKFTDLQGGAVQAEYVSTVNHAVRTYPVTVTLRLTEAQAAWLKEGGNINERARLAVDNARKGV
jgi:hypothetical protein